ncbi:MAG: cation:proton antiporter [Planctomycetes bacterium]|nr:cation:proton antiporter [Planctomycetota bacterium]
MPEALLADLGLCILGALIGALLARLLRQPPLLGYLAAGIALGPHLGAGWIQEAASVEAIARLGLVLLLFLIGAEIDLKKLRAAGTVVLVGGLVQVPACALLIALGVAPFVPGTTFELGFLGFVLALSSTAILVKVLHEQGMLDTLPGRIAVGISVLQDLWAVTFLLIQPNLGSTSLWPILRGLGLGLGLVPVILLAGRLILPHAFRVVARSGELSLLLAFAWCASVSAAATAVGLSTEMGALLAGITISTFPVQAEVVTRILALRDVFLSLFFVSLGLHLQAPSATLAGVAGLTALVAVLSRFVVLVPLVRALLPDTRTGTVAAAYLVPVSEFALVVTALGARSGQIGAPLENLIVFVFALTAVVTPYSCAHADALHRLLRPLLLRLRLRDGFAAAEAGTVATSRFLVLGAYHMGRSLAEEWAHRHPERLDELTVVDFNPETQTELTRLGVRVVFGDVANLELLAHLHPDQAEVIVCTLPDAVLRGTTNLDLLTALRRLAPRARIAVTAERRRHAAELYAAGADYVIVPGLSAGAELAEALHFDPPLGPATCRAQEARIHLP